MRKGNRLSITPVTPEEWKADSEAGAMNLALLPVFLALGAFVGFLAGLLGIGGGFTMVPVLLEIFSREGFASEHLVPMAIGTSAARSCSRRSRRRARITREAP